MGWFSYTLESLDLALHNRKVLKPYRKQLRNNGTSAEAILWNHLKQRKLRGRKFRRQHSVGPFILDFYCPEEKLAIGLDGSVHEYCERQVYDFQRTRFLEEHGIRVVRIENVLVIESPEDVAEYIARFFTGR